MMRRVAYIRSIETRQARPFLRDAALALTGEGAEPILVHTDDVVDDDDFAGETVAVAQTVDAAELVTVLRRLRVDLAVSISIPDNSSVRDAVVRQLIQERGDIDVVAHPVELAATFADKHSTKTLLERFSIATPRSVYVDGDLLNGRSPGYPDYVHVLSDRLDAVGYPAIVKPLWDCLANGMVVVRDREAFRRLVADGALTGNALVERCVDGRLCSMEVITDGRTTFCQPMVWKGWSGDGPEFAFDQVRVAGIDPVELHSRIRVLQDSVHELCVATAARGALEFEFILADDTFWCIEVNPRVSGSTGTSIAASGVNTYRELAASARPGWVAPPPRDAGFVAWQMPIARPDIDLLGLPSGTTMVRDTTFCVDGRTYETVLLRTDRTAVADFLRWCRGDGRVEHPGVDTVLTRLADTAEDLAAVRI